MGREQGRKVKVRSWASGKRSGQSGKSERGVQKRAKQGEAVLNLRGARALARLAVVFPRHMAGVGVGAGAASRKTEPINWQT